MEKWKIAKENKNFEVSDLGKIRSIHKTFLKRYHGKFCIMNKKTTISCIGKKLTPKGYQRI